MQLLQKIEDIYVFQVKLLESYSLLKEEKLALTTSLEMLKEALDQQNQIIMHKAVETANSMKRRDDRNREKLFIWIRKSKVESKRRVVLELQLKKAEKELDKRSVLTTIEVQSIIQQASINEKRYKLLKKRIEDPCYRYSEIIEEAEKLGV